MHGFSKVTIGIGAVGIILSIVIMIIGYASAFSSMDLDPEQNMIWQQNAPASWDASDIDTFSDYFVYVSDGGNVSVELIGSDEYNYFISCESTNNCYSSEISGYTYVGELYAIGDRDTRTLSFDGTGNVQIWSEDNSFSDSDYGFIGAGLGFYGCCCSIFILIIGLISAIVIKDNAQNMVVLGQPGFVSQPQFGNQPIIQQQPTLSNIPAQQPTMAETTNQFDHP
jgi:hypothetical protein